MDKTKIDQLKKKHGVEIFELTVGDKKAILKKPDRKVLSMALSLSQKDPIKFGELMLDSCWIEGDEEIRTNDSYFLASLEVLQEMVELKQASLKKI